jgi:hypothetical protein
MDCSEGRECGYSTSQQAWMTACCGLIRYNLADEMSTELYWIHFTIKEPLGFILNVTYNRGQQFKTLRNYT